MSRRIIGVRRGGSVEERIQIGLQTLDELRLYPVSDVVDKAIVVVEDVGAEYRYDYEGVGADDGHLVIAPTAGPGRWFLLAEGAGSVIPAEQGYDLYRYSFPGLAKRIITEPDAAHKDFPIADIVLWMPSAPITAGIYELRVRARGNDLLNPVNIDLKTYAPLTVHHLPLTLNPPDLQIAKDDLIEVEVESDNIDLVSDGIYVEIIFRELAYGLPLTTGNLYSVLLEDPGGTPKWEQLRPSMLAPDFAITSFVQTGGHRIELGDTLTNPNFTAAYASPPTNVDIVDDQGNPSLDVTATPGAFSYLHAYTKLIYGQSVIWTLTADDAVQFASASYVTSWVQRLYYGNAAAPLIINQAFVTGLASQPLSSTRSRTFTVTAGAGEYIWYCCRTAYGDPTFWVGGFEGGFSKVATLAITNLFGIVENYDVWRSDNLALGTTTVEVV
jgi:hypothetical protein